MKYIYFMTLFIVFSKITAQNNLIENGGFEQVQNNSFTGWYFDNILSKEAVTNDVKSGNYAVKVYTTGASFRTLKSGDFATIDVQERAKYAFSYWCKAEKGNENTEAIITWYDQDNKPLSNKTELGRNRRSASWTEYSHEVIAPDGAVKAGIAFYIASGTGSLIFDDVSFILKDAGQLGNVNPPTNIQSKIFQREIELSWNNGNATAWDIVVNNNMPVRTDKNNFVIENLSPNQLYQVKIRSVKGTITSDYSQPEAIMTKPIAYNLNDIERIPHLRTLNENGNCPQSISLYYNDLADNAQITYFIDGKSVTPSQNRLVFSKKGEQTLKIHIKETETRQWDLLYKLNVQ